MKKSKFDFKRIGETAEKIIGGVCKWALMVYSIVVSVILIWVWIAVFLQHEDVRTAGTIVQRTIGNFPITLGFWLAATIALSIPVWLTRKKD